MPKRENSQQWGGGGDLQSLGEVRKVPFKTARSLMEIFANVYLAWYNFPQWHSPKGRGSLGYNSPGSS